MQNTEPVPAVPIQEPQAPQGPLTVEEVLRDIYKRLDQQGNLLVQIADRIIAPPNAIQQAGAPPPGQLTVFGIPLGDAQGLIRDIRGALQGSSNGPDALYAQIGKTVFDKTLESTMKRVVGNIGSEAARHVTG